MHGSSFETACAYEHDLSLRSGTCDEGECPHGAAMGMQQVVLRAKCCKVPSSVGTACAPPAASRPNCKSNDRPIDRPGGGCRSRSIRRQRLCWAPARTCSRVWPQFSKAYSRRQSSTRWVGRASDCPAGASWRAGRREAREGKLLGRRKDPGLAWSGPEALAPALHLNPSFPHGF